MSKTFYITTTLPYVNAKPHMGHALEFVRADVVARYKKLQGCEVFFNTGTDEHGMKIWEAAEKEGKDVMQYIDENAAFFKTMLPKLGISEGEGSVPINFIRTTDEKHIKAAKEIWKRCNDNGFIYKKNYKSKYCVGCEEEKTDSELVDGKCPLHPTRELELIDEENYFFKLSELGEKLMALYEDEARPCQVIPDSRLNEMKAFVSRGLQDFSISRLKTKMPWGIEVPGDANHVMYVWFDALTSYIATLGWPEDTDTFEKFWINGDPTQYCGKDNTRFQSVIWQGILLGAGLPNSRRIIVNGFVTAEGGVKMSKSLGNVIDPIEIVDEYGTDALRYFVLRELAPFEDTPFSKEKMKEAYNANLANSLGNLVSRVMRMSTSNGVSLDAETSEKFAQTDIAKNLHEKQTKGFENFNIQIAADAVWEVISLADKLIQDTQPFKTIKVDKEKGEGEIRILLAYLETIAIALFTILPESSAKILSYVKDNKMPETPLFVRKD